VISPFGAVGKPVSMLSEMVEIQAMVVVDQFIACSKAVSPATPRQMRVWY